MTPGKFLSFCGPTILVLLVAVWGLLLTTGVALVMHPHLGTSIVAANGPTQTDFITAIYAASGTLSIVGASKFEPTTRLFRLLYLFNSLAGMSVLSLTLTYLMQVYSALQVRNSLGLKIYLLTRQTGDAAELIAGIGPQGQFTTGYTTLTELAGQITQMKESHHFYPVLFYFRFEQPFYSASFCTFQALDAAALLSTALDDQQYGWLKQSAAVAQLGDAAFHWLETLENAFLPNGPPHEGGTLDPRSQELWRRRYLDAIKRLRAAGIKTFSDENLGADRYVNIRNGWHRHIAALAPILLYAQDEIDPATAETRFRRKAA